MVCGETTQIVCKEVCCQLKKGHKGMHIYEISYSWGNLEQFEYTHRNNKKRQIAFF
jgi:hypothetical protein